MIREIILASKSEVRKKILEKNGFKCEVIPANIDEEIIKFAQSGLRNLHVISPGFSVDCLETLEEIQIQYEELFISNGGQNFSYIPCLNSDIDHINILKNIINENIIGW